MSITPNKKQLKKREWGSEKRTEPLSKIHEDPSLLKIALSRVAIVLTVVFWVAYIISVIVRQFIEGPKSYQFTLEAFGYSLVVTLLTFSALMYLVARQGAFQRFSKHVRVPRSIIEKFFSTHRPSITVLIPSYDEEPEVIRKTLLSAALQEYPSMRVVLLLDDNPKPRNQKAAIRLLKTRELINEINTLLAEPAARFKKALDLYERKHKNSKSASLETILELAVQYEWAAKWLENVSKKESVDDHAGIFFRDQVLLELAQDLRLIRQAIWTSTHEGTKLSSDRVHQLYRRLVFIFSAELSIFERKEYASLSHEANKAMNLNAYIGLMGGIYKKEQTPDGTILVPVKKAQRGSLIVPDSEFILTLDADSILLREYCLRLIYFLEQPDNKRVAVAQTPYSAFRGAYSRIERLAGATTDIQHIVHQGMTHHGATFWVGANAVIRKEALEDIVEKEWVGGFEVKRFIQDRTVIEDTESSIDLTYKGWRLVNYPERLSYSATPSDFGSLIIQRRRWANGGLLILPKFMSQINERKSRGEVVSKMEIMLRINYMASIAWASFGLIFLLAYPYDGRLLSPLVLCAALPYFLAMAYDLKYCGYNYTDIFRIYGFNLILLPVNMAGVLKSMEQALTGKKIPFARTPKVKNRTSAGLQFIIIPILIILFSLFTLWRNVEGQNWGNAFFAGFNATAATWAIFAYIGIGNLLVDIWYGLTNWMYVEVKPTKTKKTTQIDSPLDWKAILYHGEEEGIVPHLSIRDLVMDTSRKQNSPVVS